MGGGDTEPSLWRNHHMSETDARNAFRLVRQNRDRFLNEWRRLHGGSRPGWKTHL
jgi:hypothetical protein